MTLFRSSTAKVIALGAVVASALSASSQVWAWGATGHRDIGELAIEALPAELPAFLRTPEIAQAVGELAREPDRARGAGQPHDTDLDPGHFVDLDDAGRVNGGPLLGSLPATREAYDGDLRVAGSDATRSGYLPYSIADGYQQLAKDFAYWRVETAALLTTKAPDDRAWIARDLKLREALIVRDLGYWAHFVGDGSQPDPSKARLCTTMSRWRRRERSCALTPPARRPFSAAQPPISRPPQPRSSRCIGSGARAASSATTPAAGPSPRRGWRMARANCGT